jgi:hypothetical protein
LSHVAVLQSFAINQEPTYTLVSDFYLYRDEYSDYHTIYQLRNRIDQSFAFVQRTANVRLRVLCGGNFHHDYEDIHPFNDRRMLDSFLSELASGICSGDSEQELNTSLVVSQTEYSAGPLNTEYFTCHIDRQNSSHLKLEVNLRNQIFGKLKNAENGRFMIFNRQFDFSLVLAADVCHALAANEHLYALLKQFILT